VDGSDEANLKLYISAHLVCTLQRDRLTTRCRQQRVSVPQRPIAFSSAHGGIGLSIGPGWEKGIAYLTAVPSRVGQIVDNLDKDPGHDDFYLVPIEGDWYVFYQRTDYDNWKPGMKRN
jgi:hypothetical protein